jgi:hypothetical protein
MIWLGKGEGAHSKCSSDDEARRIYGRIGKAKRSDHTISAAFGRAEVDEQDLIFVVVDYSSQFGSTPNQVGRRELAFKD